MKNLAGYMQSLQVLEKKSKNQKSKSVKIVKSQDIWVINAQMALNHVKKLVNVILDDHH